MVGCYNTPVLSLWFVEQTNWIRDYGTSYCHIQGFISRIKIVVCFITLFQGRASFVPRRFISAIHFRNRPTDTNLHIYLFWTTPLIIAPY